MRRKIVPDAEIPNLFSGQPHIVSATDVELATVEVLPHIGRDGLTFVEQYIFLFRQVVKCLSAIPDRQILCDAVRLFYLEGNLSADSLVASKYGLTAAKVSIMRIDFINRFFYGSTIYSAFRINRRWHHGIMAETRLWLFSTVDDFCRETLFPFTPDSIDVLAPIGLGKVLDKVSSRCFIVGRGKGGAFHGCIRSLYAAMQRHITPVTLVEAVSLAKSYAADYGISVSRSSVHSLLLHHPYFEPVGKRHFQVKFQYLSYDYLRVGRILSEHKGVVMTTKSLMNVYNSRLMFEQKPIGSSSLRSLCAADSRFRSCGRAGWVFSPEE